jgi:hypothetical protein
MTTGLLENPKVGRKKTPPDEGQEKTTTKVAVDLNRMAKLVAASEGIEVFDLIDSILRPALAARHAEMLKRESARQKEGGK